MSVDRKGGRWDKVSHVRKAKQTRFHTCHWPGCTVQVPPAMWGCRGHWFTLPKAIRVEIWGSYRPGQEDSMSISPEYIAAARRAQSWIEDYIRRQPVVKP